MSARSGHDTPLGPAPPAAAPTPDFLAAIPRDYARRHLVLSAGRQESGTEVLMVTEATAPWVPFNIGARLSRTVTCRTDSAESIAAAIDAAYARAGPLESEGESARIMVEGSGDVQADMSIALRDAEQDVLHTQGKAPAVRLVDLILFEALLRSASDIHIQPVRGRTLIRYRLDGVLHTVRELPTSAAAAVVSRVKVMASLDIAETRAPQDGRATVSVGGSARAQEGRRVDLRISTLPSTYGERVVIRLLDPSRSAYLLSFEGLGMPRPIERRFLAQVSKTSGIVLSTGPTGSGKTTTLYTSLAWLSHRNAGQLARGCELNIMTVEDPVEYDLSGGGTGSAGQGLAVSQTQVDPRKNVTFASGLRHILRQDPDVIMVGEIRDQETARIATQASLTGHLVLSTLHTNDAAAAIARLIDLGIEPFLVASSLSAVLAQRLVRRTHASCAGAGCAGCLGTGFKGRTAVFELFVLDAQMRELIGRRASAMEIKSAAQRAGMIPLKDAGEALARSGATTLHEVARVIESIDEELAV